MSMVEKVAQAHYESSNEGLMTGSTRVLTWDELPDYAKADELKAARAALTAMAETAAEICEDQAQTFLSPEYATDQPLSSFAERFACAQCAKAIRETYAAMIEEALKP